MTYTDWARSRDGVDGEDQPLLFALDRAIVSRRTGDSEEWPVDGGWELGGGIARGRLVCQDQ